MRAVSTAQARLHAAWLSARAGRHEEALGEYLWFHEHALEQDRHLNGVRLSYALAHWKELADVYPPALEALLDIRNRKNETLLAGARSRALFHDVVSINERLEREYETCALFHTLARQDADFAERCGSLALPSLIGAGDFKLAARFLPDSESTIRDHAAFMNRRFAQRRQRAFSHAPVIEAEIGNYAQLVREHLTVLEGCGRVGEAAALRVLAADLIPATTLRRAVRAALLPSMICR